VVYLENDSINLSIDLENGARLTSVRWRNLEFCLSKRDNPLGWGWFSMAPFAGRIRNGIIRDSRGKTFQLPTKSHPPHAVIGFGATSRWEDLGSGEQLLNLPAPFEGAFVTQKFKLEDNSLSWSLNYQANGCDLPVTLGLHPWIARDIGFGPSAEINFKASKMFKRGSDYLPTGELIKPTPPPWDDTFTDLISNPEIIWPDRAKLQFHSNSPYFMLYSQDNEAICFEPVTAPPDAQNLGITGSTFLETVITFSEN
jgi:aldose 1-epimerase